MLNSIASTDCHEDEAAGAKQIECKTEPRFGSRLKLEQSTSSVESTQGGVENTLCDCLGPSDGPIEKHLIAKNARRDFLIASMRTTA